jgi:hypothetical protein
MKENPLKGTLLHTAFYVLYVFLWLPAMWMSFLSAIIFPIIFGFYIGYSIALAVSIFSQTLGGIFSFLVGRYLLYDVLRYIIHFYLCLKDFLSQKKEITSF